MTAPSKTASRRKAREDITSGLFAIQQDPRALIFDPFALLQKAPFPFSFFSLRLVRLLLLIAKAKTRVVTVALVRDSSRADEARGYEKQGRRFETKNPKRKKRRRITKTTEANRRKNEQPRNKTKKKRVGLKERPPFSASETSFS